MADYDSADEFGFPLTSVETLRRAAGFKPNDGVLGLNYQPGDKAKAEFIPERGKPIPGFDYDQFMARQRAWLARFK